MINIKHNRIYTILLFLLGMFTLAAAVKTVFVSIDIDESYAITQSYRLVKGDRLLRDMWEPHQFSAYLSSILIALYLFLFKTTTGLVLFLRLCGSILHLALGIGLYFTCRKFVSPKFALLLSLLHLNFLAKWIQTPEFELMQYWLLLLTFLLLVRFYEDKRHYGLLLVAGFCIMLQLLNYPTMLLLYPFYIAGIFSITPKKAEKWRYAGITTLGALIPGVLFLLCLGSYMSLSELFSNLSYVLADPSHTEIRPGVRLGNFGLEFLTDLLLLAALYILCLLAVRGLSCLVKKKQYTRRSLLLFAALAELILLCLIQMCGYLFFDQNQFFLQNRYLLAALVSLVLYLTDAKKTLHKKLLFYFAIVPSLVSTLAAVLLTNMSVNTSYSKLFLCVPVLFLYLSADNSELTEKDFLFPVLAVLGSLLVCKLLLIRVTGCLPVTVRADMAQINDGPLKGIYITRELHNALSSDYALLSQKVTQEDKLFYFGCESLLYLSSPAELSVASVQGTSVFNQDFLDYLERHPDKYPTVIAVDKTFPLTDSYHYNPYNYIVADWIENTCSGADYVETDYMTLYFLNQKGN